MKSLKELILSSGISPEKEKEFIKSIRKIKIKKGTLLQMKGDVNNKSYFVCSGMLRSYTIDAKGKEHVFMFAPEGWIIGDFQTYNNEIPTELFIDALEDSEIEVIDSKNLQEVDDLPQESLVKQVNLLSKRVGVLQNRILMLMSATALERYQEFLKTYPNISQRVPQKLIASYLGITPEALSKIRRQMVK
ncbi:Crp/Fnr family transcriptional regulator [Aureivirga sp. CE67]|uniref:Crp/Fnr family transcriptional regulator n=1 Tax=Aureivirga sp. CE67 TaxID=1788983 RepID=UPI0018CA4CDE|nr:Crp/Fnr family transcriptional regulator [Aureivirga sp. CE67]